MRACVRACVCVCVCYYEPSLLEKKVNIFSVPSLGTQLLSKCRLLITCENSSGPTKCSADNACMCSLVSVLAALFQRLSATSGVR